ncbi:MAG: glycosyltransferase family 39 protein [Acidobacteriota bacterium]
MSAAARRWGSLLAGRPGPWLAAGWTVALHLLFLVALPTQLAVNESTDFTTFYRPVAENAWSGAGWTDRDGQPAVRYPPGFPLLLVPVMAVGGGPGALAVFVGLCVGVAGGALFFWARHATDAVTAGLVALAFASYPVWLWATKQPNSELPFLSLFFLALVAWWRANASRRWPAWALAAGALVGAAALVRPIAVGLALPLAVVALLWRQAPRWRRIAAVGLLLAAQLLTVAPWVVWMHEQTGRWMPLSSGGKLSVLDGLTFAVDPGVEPPPWLSDDVETLMREIGASRAALGSTHDVLTHVARRAASDPAPVAQLLAIKAVRAWYGTESMRLDPWIAAVQAIYLALASFGMVLLWRAGGERRRLALAILFVVGYFWGMTILVLSILRYMLPAMALLMVPVAVAVGRMAQPILGRPDGLAASAMADWRSRLAAGGGSSS